MAVRDPTGAPCPAGCRGAIERAADPFRVRLTWRTAQGDIDFVWTRRDRRATPTDRCGSRMDGLARSTFRRNRIGFCVLHPIRECAGARCRYDTATARARRGRFPRLDRAAEPVPRAAGFAHEVVARDVWAELRFEGDLFETEDQRNWIDASFKTFCTPLRLPFPGRGRGRHPVQQRSRCRLRGAGSNVPGRERRDRVHDRRPIAGRTSASDRPRPLRTADGRDATELVDLLRRLNLPTCGSRSRSRIARLAGTPGPGVRRSARRSAAARSRLVRTDDADRRSSARLPTAARRRRHPSAAGWSFHESRWATAAGLVVQPPGGTSGRSMGVIPLVAGTHGNFAELNRGRPPVDLLDGVCFSAQPQEHASDNASLVETCRPRLRTRRDGPRVLRAGVPLDGRARSPCGSG